MKQGLYCLVLLIWLAISALPAGMAQAADAGAAIPTFSILAVETDKTVTIQTYNFPANTRFVARMGKMGTRGVGGVEVGTLESGAGGSLKATFDIPASLKGEYQIAIRLDATTGGYYAFNWFYNNTASGSSSGGTGTGKIPTISISAVEAKKSVTIKTADFPANTTFDVLMGKIGTRGIGGTKVGTLESGTGGSLTATFDIPDALKNDYQVAIRLESKSGYYAYNWFYNNQDAKPGGTGSLPPGVIPTISIYSVERDSKVTIKTANYPANDKFDVYMGAYGTKGVGGVKVSTLETGAGGTLTATFDIPASLKGSYQIAIRLQSPTSGYYSYNWFYNNTFMP